MTDPQEKALRSAIVSGANVAEVPVELKPRYRDSETPAYSEAKRTWRSFFWSTLDVPKQEARFLTKLDLTLISASALGVMCRYLDQVNITNAFNSGMKEDLSLYGNELNYANAVWSAAYVFGQIPSNMLLTRLNVPLYIAFLELAWTVFTFATAGVKDVNQLYVFRFFVGLFEAGHFPAVMYVCSSYYKPHELARRNTLIQVFTSVGPLFSGFLMAAVFAGLNGVGGLAGWRWMYMCVLPVISNRVWADKTASVVLPSRAKANWIFTQEEVELARARMPTEVKPLTGLFKWKDIKRWHTTWHVYLFPLFFAFMAQFGQSGGSMIFWVKSYNVTGQPAVFSVAAINIIPLGINVITIVCTLLNSWISDSLPGAARWPDLTALGGTSAGITWTWVNEVNRHDPEKRAYISALMNAFAYIFTAWIPIFTFPTSQQPYIVTGNYITAGFGAAATITVLVIRHFHNRDLKGQHAQRATSPVDSE
ncbi:hypothetical protein TruAng_010405 [Truncatella angustata]|nr:hypothetical protein TruAng_010405 [Truncatella angustata]